MGSALPTPLFCKGGCRWGNGSLSGCVLRRRGGGGSECCRGALKRDRMVHGLVALISMGASDTLLGKCCVKSTNKCSREELTRSRPVSWPIVIGSAYKANGPCLPYQRERDPRACILRIPDRRSMSSLTPFRAYRETLFFFFHILFFSSFFYFLFGQRPFSSKVWSL
jgi:hypothetical protein